MRNIDNKGSDIDFECPFVQNINAEWDLEPELDKPPKAPELEATA
jgi:hypothetical protein